MKIPKGINMFTNEWLELVAPHVPAMYRTLILEICEGYQIGNSADVNILYEMISNWCAKNKLTNNKAA